MQFLALSRHFLCCARAEIQRFAVWRPSGECLHILFAYETRVIYYLILLSVIHHDVGALVVNLNCLTPLTIEDLMSVIR